MIGRGVVGHEVQHQAQAAAREPLAQARQRRIAAEVVVNGIGGDGERRSGDVLVAQIGQHATTFLDHLHVGARDRAPRGTGLPDAEEPDPAEAAVGDLVEHAVVDVVQRRAPPERDAALVQRHARVDLVQRRVRHRPHGFAPGASMFRCCSRLRSARLTPVASNCSGRKRGKNAISAGMIAVHPVWWLAPSPAPLSPWKYS